MAKALTQAQIALNNAVTDAGVALDKTPPAVSVEVVGTVLHFTFGDGTKATFDCGATSVEISERARMHGFEQKIRDAAALPTKVINGRTMRPTVAEKKFEVLAMMAQLNGNGNANQGVWNAGRESSGVSGGGLFEAFTEAFPGKFADLEAFNAKIAERAAVIGVDGKETGEATVRKTLAAIPAVAAIIARNRAAKKSDGNDGSDLLDSFMSA